MEPRYFQGQAVTGLVQASSAASWKDIVDIFRMCPTLPLKRAAFLALDKPKRNEAKQVPFFVPACFKESPSKRVTEQATVCNIIFLDLDEQKDGTCPAAPFVHNPKSLYEALEGFNFLAHTTASSTSQKPRMRIVVDGENIPVKDYPQAVATVGALLGLTRITIESRVATQPMFNPVLFLDSTDEDHPLIAHRQEGRAFTVQDISSTAPAEWEHHGKNGSNGSAPHGADALFFLKSPVPEITLSIAKEALAEIDPDCSYYEWLGYAAALRHQFSPHKAEEAYELFDEWSATGSKYVSEEDTRAKWDSLRPTPVGRMPVTIRSLLHKAVEAGWNDQRVKDGTYHKLLDWMEHVDTATQLLEQGVNKILAAPLMSTVQESMLIDELRKHAKRRFAINVQATAIKQDLARLKAQIKAKEREEERKTEKVKEPRWAIGVIYVSNPGDYFRRATGEKYKEANFDAAYSCHLLPTEAQLQEAGKPVSPATLCQPIVPPSDYARNFLKITKVYDYDYDPSQPNEVFFVRKSIKYVNTYHPTYPEPEPARKEEAGRLILAHRDNLIAEPEYRRTFVDFMAYMVQFPGRKIRWAVLIQSAEGAGKTFFAKAMQAALGYDHVKILSDESIKSGWNEWAFGHQLVAVEEIRVVGHNRHEIMNVIKPLITNDDINITERYRNSRQARNITNYLLFTNFHDALALTPNDRRYFVVKSPLQSEAQIKALGKDYFIPLFDFLDDHPGAIRSWLSDWKISPDFCANGRAPRTKYANTMIDDSANDLTASVRRLLLEADYPLIQYDIVSAKTLMDVLRLEEGLGHVTGQQVAHVLREEGLQQMGRFPFGEERHYLWARSGVEGVFETAVERLKKNLKNLCMELIF